MRRVTSLNFNAKKTERTDVHAVRSCQIFLVDPLIAYSIFNKGWRTRGKRRVVEFELLLFLPDCAFGNKSWRHYLGVFNICRCEMKRMRMSWFVPAKQVFMEVERVIKSLLFFFTTEIEVSLFWNDVCKQSCIEFSCYSCLTYFKWWSTHKNLHKIPKDSALYSTTCLQNIAFVFLTPKRAFRDYLFYDSTLCCSKSCVITDKFCDHKNGYRKLALANPLLVVTKTHFTKH